MLRDKLAEAEAYLLTKEGHENKTYPLTNIESVSFTEIAEDLSSVLNKEIQYQSPPVDEFVSILTQAGVPNMYIGMFTIWATAQVQSALNINNNTLTSFLGRQPTTVKQFIKQVYK